MKDLQRRVGEAIVVVMEIAAMRAVVRGSEKCMMRIAFGNGKFGESSLGLIV